EAQLADAARQKIEANKTAIDNKEQELGLLESELNLNKSLYAGLGPQLDLMSKMNDKLEEAGKMYADNAKKALEQFNKTGVNSYYQLYLEYQNKAVATEQKRIDMTKNLREGYLDAMSAF